MDPSLNGHRTRRYPPDWRGAIVRWAACLFLGAFGVLATLMNVGVVR